jgi:MoxR-like ATPase
LTGDSLLKILAIVSRCRCKVPVVLLGECGCGKTMLLSFLCKWLGVTLISLDVHGGTTENEIIGIFDKAASILTNADTNGSSLTVFVFLDEVNTCAHMGLLNEAICHRSLYGRRLNDGIQILAALNPYRLRKKKEEMGLTFSLGSNPQVCNVRLFLAASKYSFRRIR